ncbi:MAG: type II and III secretion system protein family protein [Vicinamibacterales bacterium]
MTSTHPVVRHCILLTFIAAFIAMPVPGSAQSSPVGQNTRAAEALPSGTDMVINLTAGRSTVLSTDFDIRRIAVTNPAVADATVVQPREVLIDGKSPGTISLIIWGNGAERVQYDLVVAPAVTQLQQRLHELFPGEDVQVTVNDEALVLSGHVSSTEVMLKMGEIAQSTASKLKVINMLQLPAGVESNQVMLQVRFAEVNRRALTELGVSLFTGATGYKDWIGRGTTQQFAAPNYEDLSRTVVNGQVESLEGQITFSDFLNIFVLNTKYNVGALVKALQQKGYFQSLAEPNLIAYNGQEASFLAGGEFPVPVVQGITNAVTIQWKEFGVRLRFTPTIAGDTIRLRVRPEVSTLDFNNGITLSGFRIPALSSRWAETDVELRDGQSFAIAGLMDNVSQDVASAVPGLSSIPIIGNLFKSKRNSAEQTELMVLITPRLVRALSPDEVPPLPTDAGRFLKKDPGGIPGGPGGLLDGPPGPPPGRLPEKKDSGSGVKK